MILYSVYVVYWNKIDLIELLNVPGILKISHKKRSDLKWYTPIILFKPYHEDGLIWRAFD